MANVLHPDVIDGGLTVLDVAADAIYLVSADPTSYADAIGTLALGHKTFSAGGVFGPPAAATPNGLAVTSTPITDGTITASGTATGWAVVDTTMERLLANGDLAASQSVTVGNTFSLGPFTIRIPNQ